ncbi:MAG: hypothetical protein HDR03_09420 [Lachnospiraceae bacterium]|nr:hypothetical protein [Lachnospiraceae bacterium]
MSIEVIRVEPLEIPADIVWQICAKQKIALKDFYLYVQEKEDKMYVNKSVPEKDIEKFIELMTFPGRYILDDDTEMGKYMDYVYETYGFAAYCAISDYHQYKMNKQEEQQAKEKAQSAIPSIEKMISARMFDENMIYEAYSAGNDRKGQTPKNICSFSTVYSYCLGYLVGSGALKEKHSPEESENVVDYYYGITEMLENIDIQEMPRIYGYLKEMYFTEGKGGVAE